MVGYVILHYKNADITQKCVDSLLKMINDSDSQIVIVDNGSNNGSYEIIRDKYSSNDNIKVVETGENLGFARGNNFGFNYLKNSFDLDLIVVCNNDLIFEQLEFESLLLKNYAEQKFDVAGPDIINLDNVHQNPHREKMLTLKEINRLNRNKKIFLAYLKVKKCIPFLSGIRVLENKFDRGSTQSVNYKCQSGSLVLQGSCIMFGKRFIVEQKTAFNEETFLYFEEDILAINCKKNNYKTVVLPEVRVKHLEGKSTESVATNDVDKRIFTINNMLKSGQVYARLLKEQQ